MTTTDAKTAADELSVLTACEREALVLFAKGLSAAEIGAQINRSEDAISGRLQSMRQRLNMTTIEAIVLAVKAGWV